MTTYKLFADKLGGTDPTTFIGVKGDLFYNPANGGLCLSDGITPGGVSTTPTFIASDGLAINPNAVSNHTLGYDASGNLITDTYVDLNGNTYRQTFTWTNGLLMATSNWMKQ
jgi:hypothetical protein